MAISVPTITGYFDVSANDATYFTVEDAVLGLLDTGGVLAGDIATDLTGYGFGVSIRRGRDRELDEITTGTCEVVFRNQSRTFDPGYASGALYPNLVPGKRFTVSMYGVTIFDGSAEDWFDDYTVSGDHSSSVVAVDALGLLARKDFDEWTTTSQAAGARIAAVLARSEVNYAGGVDLDAGVDTLQADLATWGSNVLNYLQLVATSDLGRLFASRTGVLKYVDRTTTAGSTPIVSFADDGTGVAFSAVRKRSTSELLYTRVGVDREGGILQTSTDAAAVTTYGVRTLSMGGLLLNTDIQSGDLADWLLNIYKDPQDRIAELTVLVSGIESTATQAAVASLDIGDTVEVTWTPANVGTARTDLCVVEGVQHRIGMDGFHVMTLSLSNLTQDAVFIIEDDVLGLLDTGGGLTF